MDRLTRISAALATPLQPAARPASPMRTESEDRFEPQAARRPQPAPPADDPVDNLTTRLQHAAAQIKAAAIGTAGHLINGGLNLLDRARAAVQRVSTQLHDKLDETEA